MKNIQIQMEQNAKNRAVGKFNMSVDRAINTNNEFETSYGRNIIVELYPLVEKFVKEQMVNKSWGKLYTVATYLKPAQITYSETLALWEEDRVGKKPKDPIESFCYTVTVGMVNTISSEPSFLSAADKLAKVTLRFFEVEPAEQQEAREKMLGWFGKMLMEVANVSTVFDIEQTYNDQYFLNVSVAWVEIIEDYRRNAEASAQEFRPMVCKPINHTNLYSTRGGYLATPSPILKRPGRVLGERDLHPSILNFNSKTNPAFFHYINKLQSTPLCVNNKLFEVMNELKEEGLEFTEYKDNIDSYTDLIQKDYDKDISDRTKSRKSYCEFAEVEFEEYKESFLKFKMKEVRSKYKEKVNKTIMIMKQCEELVQFPEIFYPVFCDHRGRVYPYATYGLTPQGDELSKAMLQLANKIKLTERGVDALYATLGNALGHDKKNLTKKVRIASEWFSEWNETQDYTVFVTDEKSFDEPVNALAICLELVEYHKNPDYLCGYIAHRDARCSGTSIMSTILRDIKGMRLTSVTEHGINTQTLPDAYQTCCNETYDIVKKNKRYEDLLPFEDTLFTRSNFKSPVMLRNYGGTYFGLANKHKDLFREEDLPREVAHLFTEATNTGLAKAVPACIKFLDSINSVVSEVAKKNRELIFTNPINGFPVVIQEFKEITKKVKVQTSFKAVQLNLKTYTDEVDFKKLKSVAAPNFIHALDSAMLCAVGSVVAHDVVFIHDSLGSHPNYCHVTVKAYSSAMYKLATENVFDSIYEQLGTEQKVPYVNTASNEDIAGILKSKHILC